MAQVVSRKKHKARTAVGRAEKSLLRDPGPELRLRVRRTRRANKDNGMGGKDESLYQV